MKKLLLVLTIQSLLMSCTTSMSPVQFSNTFPALTNSFYYNQNQANEAIINDKCKIIVSDRSYNALMGLSVKSDMKDAAKGVDDWVKIDGGNAFILNNYKWVTLDINRATQLEIDFDTMKCQ